MWIEDRDPTDLAGQAQRHEAEKARERLARRNEVEDLRWLMDRPQGRRFIARVIERSGVEEKSFDTNALQMARNEGCEELGRWVLRMAKRHCLDQYHLLEKEQIASRNLS